MKKVISIAVSSLLLSNISFAQNATADNSVLQSIQQKIEAKKSGLGAHVQTNSGLSGLSNKSSNKDMSEITKSVNVTQSVTTDITKEAMPNVTTNVTTPSILSNTKDIKDIKNIKKTTEKQVVTKEDSKAISDNSEICDPLQPKVYKKPVKKHIVKKTLVKKAVVKKTIVNNFEMVKTQNYTPVDFSQNKWILNSQVNTTIKEHGSHIEVSIFDKQGQTIPKEQFNKDFIRVVQIKNNFKDINHQEQTINTSHNSYMFDKLDNNCSAIFVQYHLKSSAIATTLVKYLSHEGLLRDSIDSSCPQGTSEDLATNVNYSASNNISGLIFKDNKLVSSKPVSFNIIFSKDGVIKIPNELFVYALKNDFSDLTVFEPKNYGHAASGVLFEQNLERGQYILGYSFKESKKENFFKNINVQ